MFKKITTVPNVAPIEVGSEKYVSYGVYEDGEFRGIEYGAFNAPSFLVDAFKQLIPDEYADQFYLSLMSINRPILPHVDSHTNTAINLYVETGGYVTSFCTPKENAKSFRLPIQDVRKDGIVYHFEDVDMTDNTFVAETGDVYVLDVSRLHCVYAANDPKCKRNRVALNFATQMSYEDVLDIIAK